MERRYDAILIDFYGTICSGDREAVAAVCGRMVDLLELSMTPDELAACWGKRFFAALDDAGGDSFQTLHECERASLRATLRQFDRDVAPNPFVAEIEEYWANPPVYADATAFLEAVGLPVCCVSNADTAPLTAAVRRHGLKFTEIVTSEMARCYKPGAAIFRKALDRLGVDPHRAMHIGDSLHSDIAGAAAVGITTIWVRRESRIHDIGTAVPDHMVTSLTPVLELLSG